MQRVFGVSNDGFQNISYNLIKQLDESDNESDEFDDARNEINNEYDVIDDELRGGKSGKNRCAYCGNCQNSKLLEDFAKCKELNQKILKEMQHMKTKFEILERNYLEMRNNFEKEKMEKLNGVENVSEATSNKNNANVLNDIIGASSANDIANAGNNLLSDIDSKLSQSKKEEINKDFNAALELMKF